MRLTILGTIFGAALIAPHPVQDNVAPSMQATGKTTLARFHELKSAGTPGTYMVKFSLTQNGATEHLWMKVGGYRDRRFLGRLAGTPVNGLQCCIGDYVTVAEADVEDWMISGPDAIYGGYTTRMALKGMPKAEADKYRSLFRD